MLPIYHEKIVVTQNEIDILGHVNNQNYLKWMEMIATAHSAKNGWSFSNLSSKGYMWVARQHWLEYLKPTFVGETIDLFTWVQGLKGATSLRRYAFIRGKELVFIGATEWAFLSKERLRPMLIPDEVKSSFTLLSPMDERLVELGINKEIKFTPNQGLLE